MYIRSEVIFQIADCKWVHINGPINWHPSLIVKMFKALSDEALSNFKLMGINDPMQYEITVSAEPEWETEFTYTYFCGLWVCTERAEPA